MTRDTLDRRTVLKTITVGAASAALAGCTSTGDTGGSDGSDTSASDTSNENEDSDTTKESGGSDSGSNSVSFDGWFDDVSNYDGVADKTGSSEVTVEVGAEGNNGAFGFGPAALEVASGTKVVWKWTGEGGAHNVVTDSGEFESEMKSEAGYTFSHTFESSGTYKYYCEPHKTMGMKGAIVVE
ncbi:halocyanin domain-containing protein [Halorussus halophilus]|uniref:halocyanin domain-containing protein n=1 Tax=Halorussus halophilus TaxID=2650975 RepID=UPI0013019A3C|nr:halocyanin domain-containing protein [Halorussus halophilus]